MKKQISIRTLISIIIFLIIFVTIVFIFILPWFFRWNLLGLDFGDASGYYSAVNALAIIAAIIGFFWNENKNRKEKAVDLLLNWNQQLNEKGSSARKLVDSLDVSQCKKLNNEQSFELNNREQVMRFAIVFHDNEEIRRKAKEWIENFEQSRISHSYVHPFIVDENSSARLRWLIISYLNSLESVLSAWHLKMVDRDLIEKEFSYLANQSWASLSKFRYAAEMQNLYPVIDEFMNKIK